jgi:hypothetical protein
MKGCQLSFLIAQMMKLKFRRNKFCIRCVIGVTNFWFWRGGVEQGKKNPTMASLNRDHNREVHTSVLYRVVFSQICNFLML